MLIIEELVTFVCFKRFKDIFWGRINSSFRKVFGRLYGTASTHKGTAYQAQIKFFAPESYRHLIAIAS
jgi:hypothetical protein